MLPRDQNPQLLGERAQVYIDGSTMMICRNAKHPHFAPAGHDFWLHERTCRMLVGKLPLKEKEPSSQPSETSPKLKFEV
jgi:hypothetical protein